MSRLPSATELHESTDEESPSKISSTSTATASAVEEESASTMPLAAIGAGDGFGDHEDFSDEAEDSDGGSLNLLQNGTLIIGIVALIAVGAIVVMRMTKTSVAADSSTQKASAKIEDALSRFHHSGSMSANDPLLAFTDGGDPLAAHQQIIQSLASTGSAEQVPIQYVQKNPFLLAFSDHDDEDKDKAKANQTLAQKRAREKEHINKLRKEAEGLKLNMVMRGPQLTALVNGGLYKKGDDIGSFYVEKIEPSQISLRSGKYRFRLRISDN